MQNFLQPLFLFLLLLALLTSQKNLDWYLFWVTGILVEILLRQFALRICLLLISSVILIEFFIPLCPIDGLLVRSRIPWVYS